MIILDESGLVLVVDDDRETTIMMKRLLYKSGLRVLCATSFSEALEVSANGKIDILLTDLHLPDGDGLDLVGALAASNPDIRGIVCSGTDAATAAGKCRAAGYAAYLEKPIDFSKLLIMFAQSDALPTHQNLMGYSKPFKPPSPPPQRKILIVEDDKRFRDGVVLLLRVLGHEVVTTGTLRDGMSMMGSHPSHILLDTGLPDGVGTSLLRHVRSEGLPVKVAILSGWANDSLLMAKDVRPDAMFTKPPDWDSVLRWLNDEQGLA